VPRIIPNHGKRRERTISRVTSRRTIDPDADVGEGLDADGTPTGGGHGVPAVASAVA
jgi:hypothetical protein